MTPSSALDPENVVHTDTSKMGDSGELQKPHVCIVGAGIAGLRCAAVLLEKAVQVTMLEARNRIGGRICQSDGLGYSVDLGPQWIHTSGSNPLLHIAAETNTVVHTWNGKSQIYDENGQLVDSAKADQFSDLVWELVGEAIKYSEENGDQIPETQSLSDFFVTRAAELFPDRPEDQSLLLNMSQMWGAYVGHPPDKQSLRFAWMEKCCVGDEVIVTSTYGAILEKIAEVPILSADIQFNKLVVGIETQDDARDKNSQVFVRTDDGCKQSFDEVILTTPLGWLKRNKSAFSPALPPQLSRAIDNISVGYLEKVYITFPSAFWLDSSADSTEDSFPGYTNFLSPRHSPETNPSHWPQEAYNLAAFAVPHKHPTLLFYLYGDCSQSLVALSSPSPSNHQTHHPILHPSSAGTSHPLYPFFLPYIALLPHYSPTSPACVPSRILNTTWQLDALAGNGSYVNFQVPVKDAAGDVRCMREGMGATRKVWLAGEHTSPFEECGTATGAFLAGEEVGERILKMLGLGR
ncbi:hypothetical protein MMC07_003173 [Pseudocyphellaria aurata]|nr:hypothetical protein [Pseudocyphellaria aurata]